MAGGVVRHRVGLHVAELGRVRVRKPAAVHRAWRAGWRQCDAIGIGCSTRAGDSGCSVPACAVLETLQAHHTQRHQSLAERQCCRVRQWLSPSRCSIASKGSSLWQNGSGSARKGSASRSRTWSSRCRGCSSPRTSSKGSARSRHTWPTEWKGTVFRQERQRKAQQKRQCFTATRVGPYSYPNGVSV